MKNKNSIFLIICLGLFSISCSIGVNVNNPAPLVQEVKPVIGNPNDVKANPGFFALQPLGYAYDALEPHIDARTMEVHYSKHYLGYTNNLNKAIAELGIQPVSIENLLKNLDMNNMPLRNNAGGYYNHNLFWENLTKSNEAFPKGELAKAIVRDFGSFTAFKTKMAEAGAKQFGSGWAWLVTDADGKLSVGSTPNQDNPLMPGMKISGTPVLALDVWEHAYYLKYQNKRDSYIEAFFNVINWDVVNARYEKALKK